MFSSSLSSLLTYYFAMLMISGISGLLLLHHRIPVGYVRFHIGIVALPPIVSLVALFNTSMTAIVGPWHLDSLAWLMACFVTTIGLIIQRFSMRYLLGDRSYRKYFMLFTFLTGTASIAWLSEDLRLLVVCWGATLLGLIYLIRLNKGWKVTSIAAMLPVRLFIVGWLALVLAIIWLSHVSGSWGLSLALTSDSLGQLGTWEKTCINLLLVLAVMIPAAQWPFQRWLIESAVVPTPVSAIMHAGIVNAGGIILTRFSPLFTGDAAQIILLVFASISVLIGSGISAVQVDYKRQLVGSTIAQMGFMLIQCALGAYLAAIIHLMLHGLFKATLFLQSGSAVHRYEGTAQVKDRSSSLWIGAGYVLGLLAGIALWKTNHVDGYQLVSAVILGWSLSLSWKQLVAFSKGIIVRIAGLFLLGGAAAIYFIVHNIFYTLLHTTDYQSGQPNMFVVILVISLLIFGNVIGILVTRNRTSAFSAVLYLWLIKLGEANSRSIESHPIYLTQHLSEGGYQR